MKCDFCGREYSPGFIKTHRRYYCPYNPANKYVLRLTPNKVKKLRNVLKKSRAKALREVREDLDLLLYIAEREAIESPKIGQLLKSSEAFNQGRIDRQTWEQHVPEQSPPTSSQKRLMEQR